MIIIEDVLETNKKYEDLYIAIGAFDGIHLGHRELINNAVKRAKEKGGKSAVFTFLNHPMEIIDKNRVPKMICSLDEKIHIIENLGVDYLILQPFTKEFAEKTEVEFVNDILLKRLNVKEIFVGFNFTFGKAGKGDINSLRELGESYNIKVNIESPVKIDGEIISSTLIRKSLEEGELDKANNYLGQPFMIIGNVEHGKKLGRQMGFPTANLRILNKIYPPFGIYGGKVKIEDDETIYDAVINIGKNPTLKPNESSIEVHILDFNRDIYDKKIYLFLMEYLREERKFASMEELKKTIQNDVKNWRSKLKNL